MDLHTLRPELLAARDARAATIQRLVAGLPAGQCLVCASLNSPGPKKNPPGAEALLLRARQGLRGQLMAEGRDALGPWMGIVVWREASRWRGGSGQVWREARWRGGSGQVWREASASRPKGIKQWCVEIEEATPAGRLLDLDVFTRDGRQVDRASLGLPPRRCLVCNEPAVDCMRARRHDSDDLENAVEGLLRRDACERLAEALVRGARTELELTPKPGLVDRRDNGSHPDLSFELMSRSIELLPQYFEDLLGIALRGTRGLPAPLDLPACIAAGRRAEARMVDAIGSNAHRGYIFLAGLVLLARASGATDRPALQGTVANLAARILSLPSREDAETHGRDLRLRLGIGGIHAEALAGLPAVFDCGLPALEHGLATQPSAEAAHHLLMARLMTVVEDTTALHRAGQAGLERLRRDGRHMVELIESGADYLPFLAALNDEYRAARLTMGGVADCMALTIAIQESVATGQ